TVVGIRDCDATSPVTGGRDVVAALGATLGMRAAVGPGPNRAPTGVAILTTRPILGSGIAVVTVDGAPLTVLMATIDLDGRPVRFAVPAGDAPAEAVADALADAVTVPTGPDGAAADPPPREMPLVVIGAELGARGVQLGSVGPVDGGAATGADPVVAVIGR
ncbi:MAG: hypothetical protein ABMB14_25030, partial [Myxococcota bacterium]